jgi:hypothetical protein
VTSVYVFLLSFNEEINFLCTSFNLLIFPLVSHLDLNVCFILQFSNYILVVC